jgi:hypothetical protein
VLCCTVTWPCLVKSSERKVNLRRLNGTAKQRSSRRCHRFNAALNAVTRIHTRLHMAAIAIECASPDIGCAVEQVPSVNPSMASAAHTSPPQDATMPLVEDTTTTAKKKKKKKSKKSAKSKGEPNAKPLVEDDEPSPQVLRISRNKHWRYISSYHVCHSPLDPPSSCFTTV